MATMYVAALHHLMQCWGQHPLLARLAAPLAERDRFIRTVAGLAMAKLLFDGGNRVGFSLSGDDVDLHFTTPVDEPLSLALLAPDALQWRQKDRRSPDVLRGAVIDAVASAQGRVNRSKPGIVVLAVSILQPDFDQMVVDAIHAAFQTVGRRHRGVAAVAVVMPKVLPVGPPDRVGFGYALYPIRNPRFAGENPIRLGSRAGPLKRFTPAPDVSDAPNAVGAIGRDPGARDPRLSAPVRPQRVALWGPGAREKRSSFPLRQRGPRIRPPARPKSYASDHPSPAAPIYGNAQPAPVETQILHQPLATSAIPSALARTIPAAAWSVH